jgi:hypothetical protein
LALEYHYNTREQVLGYLDDARAIVAELELDDDLRVPAFLKAADLLSAKNVSLTQADVTPGVLPAMHIPKERH